MKRSLSTALLGIIILIPAMLSFAGDCGDVDNDNNINILDIVYLINYIYKNGPQPDCGPEIGLAMDIDGNVYQTVKIGDQWWMAENLNVTHYRNGDPIPNVTDDMTWEYLTTGAYCDYGNNAANADTYGRLYNWYAVDDGRNIAPEGWHVATDDDWKQLETYLGMSLSEIDQEGWRGTDEGGKLKESGTLHWSYPNTGGTNESAFTAIPGGYRDYNGIYYYIGYNALFWTSTEFGSSIAWRRFLSYSHSEISRYYESPKVGGSIRCVKD